VVGFFKVDSDGYALGAQRRPTDQNDLPQVRAEIAEYLRCLRAKESVAPEDFTPTLGLVVSKEKIAANGEFNLSGERYQDTATRSVTYPLTTLGDVTLGKPQYGSGARKEDFDGKVRYVRITDLADNGELKPNDSVSPSEIQPEYFLEPGDILVARSGSVGRAYLHTDMPGLFQYAGYLIRFRIDLRKALPSYVIRILHSPVWWQWIESNSKTGTLTNINAQQYASFEFPLPPLEVQKEIVAEIEGYQKVINGGRTVLDHYRPHISIQADWPIGELGRLCAFKNGLNFKTGESGHTIKIIGVGDFQNHLYAPIPDLKQVNLDEALGDEYLVKPNDILFVRSNGNPDLVGRSMIIPPTEEQITFSGFSIRARVQDDQALPLFLAHFFKSRDFAERIKEVGQGANIRNLTQAILSDLKIPLPPLKEQREIVAEIEAEQRLVSANRELIERMEKKIHATIARVWSTNSPEVSLANGEA